MNTQGRTVDFNSSLHSIDSSYVNTVEQSKINGYLPQFSISTIPSKCLYFSSLMETADLYEASSIVKFVLTGELVCAAKFSVSTEA